MNFILNHRYSHEEIYRSLGVGNAGGVRFCSDEEGKVRRAVVLTSVPTARIQRENPYHDRVEGDVLVYTGVGQEGDQALGGRNRRILEQATEPFPVYCFQLLGSRRDREIGVKRWLFIGMLDYMRHYRETQIDARQKPREVCVFEFRVITDFKSIGPDHDSRLMADLIAESRTRPTTTDDRELGKTAPISDGFMELAPLEAEKVRSQMLALTPQGFEHLVRDVLVGTGFTSVNVTRFSQDGGIDVNACAGHSMWPIRNLMVQIQAKRWLHTVGRKEVAELRGSLHPHARGAVVTTSQFSRAAITEATDGGKSPIVLIDGYDFARIAAASKVLYPSGTPADTDLSLQASMRL